MASERLTSMAMGKCVNGGLECQRKNRLVYRPGRLRSGISDGEPWPRLFAPGTLRLAAASSKVALSSPPTRIAMPLK